MTMQNDDYTVQSSFGNTFLSVNDFTESGFSEFVFVPTMLFEAADKWWGDEGMRDTRHEGLDIFAYRTVDRKLRYLDEHTQIPVMYSGRVERVIPDFLGKSVFFSHGQFTNENRTLYTMYGHITPGNTIVQGMVADEGDIIGTIAKSDRKTVRSHLHISMAWIDSSITPDDLNWETIGSNDKIKLFDPLPCTGLTYTVMKTFE